jgi:hypothetical protein
LRHIAFLIFGAVLFCCVELLAPSQASAQPLPIGVHVAHVDSCLEVWSAKPPTAAEQGDSACCGVKFWDLDGHLLYLIDTAKRLIKVDWLTYMPVGQPQVDSIALSLGKSLNAKPFRARDEKGVYWIWDNDEIHYQLCYGKMSDKTMRLLEFEDQSAFESCSLQH